MILLLHLSQPLLPELAQMWLYRVLVDMNLLAPNLIYEKAEKAWDVISSTMDGGHMKHCW